MEATSTRHATSAARQEVMPGCPQCGSSMVVRAQWHSGLVQGLYWACRRAPGCDGARRIRRPEEIRPLAHDASAQAIFDWESSHERRASFRREAYPRANGGLRGMMSRALTRPAVEAKPEIGYDGSGAVGYFDGLVEHGYIVLEDRSLHSARAMIDNLLIGPSGVFIVERKEWTGQISITTDSIYVDGRLRVGATDAVLRASAAFDQTLSHELKPLGISAKPALLFERAANRSFEGALTGVTIGGTRGLPKQIRGRSEPVLGPETIVRLAVAADRLLE